LKPQIITALDFNDYKKATDLVNILGSSIDYYKVGLETFVLFGHELIEFLKNKDKKIFLDLKFHDIPNTVASVSLASLKFGVDIFNMHIQGGSEMMQMSVDKVTEYCEQKNIKKPLIIGVTLLTSLDESHFKDFNINFSNTDDCVLQLASIAKQSGLDGVVSSAKETAIIKDRLGEEFITVTPGIRPSFAATNDQKRIVTPKDAKKLGTDFMVIGRPITKADDPVKAVELIKEELMDD
jgi:orotidine-5'-phosphate decarboxylase